MSDHARVLYPYVQCTTDGGIHLGYCVCVHVRQHERPIAHFVPANPKEAGELLCAECTKGRVADLVLICAACLNRILAEHLHIS